MEALDQASQAAADKAATLEAAIAACAAQTDLDSAQDAIAALRLSTQALAEADEAQAEAVAGKLGEGRAALDALRCAFRSLPGPGLPLPARRGCLHSRCSRAERWDLSSFVHTVCMQ